MYLLDSRTIYVDINSPHLGFPYMEPCICQSNIHPSKLAHTKLQKPSQIRCEYKFYRAVQMQYFCSLFTVFVMYLRWSGGGEEGGPGSPNGCDPLYGGRRRSHTAVDWAIPCNAVGKPLQCNG